LFALLLLSVGGNGNLGRGEFAVITVPFILFCLALSIVALVKASKAKGS